MEPKSKTINKWKEKEVKYRKKKVKKKNRLSMEDKIYQSLEIKKANFDGYRSPFQSKGNKKCVIIRRKPLA